MNISIIARPSYWERDARKNGHTNEKYMHRLSTRIRGEEIVEYIGGKFNPKDRQKEETYIFVKPRNLTNVQDGDYVDLLDDIKLIPLLKERPKINIIAMSDIHFEYLKKELPNKIILIPHHHINFGQEKRTRNKSLVGGIIGSPSKMIYEIVDKIRISLAKVGIEFTICFNAKTRQEMISYYKSIDFLVNWYLDIYTRDCFYRHPTKIINAASFGIPTLAQPILGYREVEGFYIPIETIDDIVTEAEKLKDMEYYTRWSAKLIKEAEKYHISNIAKLYQNL
jgi:hypothetical protein